MGSLVRDTRVAARMLWRSPGFTAVALVTIALGIGGNTAMFSVVNAVLLRPLPYARPERLVAVYQTLASRGISSNGVSWLNYSDFAERTRSFESLGAVRMHDFTLIGEGEPALVAAGTLTSKVFPMLGSDPLLGRGLLPSDDAAGAAPVAVLTEKLWRERFGGDAAALGRTVLLDQRPFTIVGVMPAVFETPPNVPPAELWTPLPKDPVFEDLRQRRGGHYGPEGWRVGLDFSRTEGAMPTAKSESRPGRSRARDECTPDTLAVEVRVGPPRVRPHVVPVSNTAGLAREDLITSFIVVWQPLPPPQPLWIRFLKEAPFGTQLVRAADLHWDGKFLSIELLEESAVEAYAAEMSQWVDYANSELSHCQKSPAALAFKEAQKRASEIENRLRR